jgi:anion-transporting  ArsA/GET3 family ATPase
MVAGKGGVGKTAVSVALVELALEAGLRPLLVSVEAGGVDLDDVLPTGTHLAVTPDRALADYLADHGLGRISRRLAASGAIDVIATAAPGIRDLLVLGKVKQLERSGEHDLIVVDAPAAGHAVTFLTSPAALQELVRSGPVRSQADEVLDMLGDPDRCSVLLVTLPEELPVNETVDTAFLLEDKVGVKLGPVILNAVRMAAPGLRVAPEEAAAAAGRTLAPTDRDRLADAAAVTMLEAERHAHQRDRLSELLPLPQLVLPLVAVDGVAAIAHLADGLRAAILASTAGGVGPAGGRP